MNSQPFEGSPLLQFVPFVVLSLLFGIVAFLLARDKGRNVTLWTILGILPMVNFICIWYFVGASNVRLERKVDELLRGHNRS